MRRLNLLSMQKNAEAKRRQRREEQRAKLELTQTICSSLAFMAAAWWASGNTRASTMFRPGQQPVVRGFQEEQVEALQEEECTPQSNCVKALKSKKLLALAEWLLALMKPAHLKGLQNHKTCKLAKS